MTINIVLKLQNVQLVHFYSLSLHVFLYTYISNET